MSGAAACGSKEPEYDDPRTKVRKPITARNGFRLRGFLASGWADNSSFY